MVPQDINVSIKKMDDLTNGLVQMKHFNDKLKEAENKAVISMRQAKVAYNIEVGWFRNKANAIEELQKAGVDFADTLKCMIEAMEYSNRFMQYIANFQTSLFAFCGKDIALINAVLDNIEAQLKGLPTRDLEDEYQHNLVNWVKELQNKRDLLSRMTRVERIVKSITQGPLWAVVGVIVIAIAIMVFLHFKSSNSQAPNIVVPEAETQIVEPDIPAQNTLVDTPEITDGNGVMHLSYGIYKGEIKDGYPDGIGSLTYSKERVINKNDSKKRVAKEGERVEGEFAKGFLVTGKHYDANGELIQTLMIGVSPNDDFEEK